MHETIICSRKCLFVIGSHHPGNPVATVATANENTIPKSRGHIAVFKLVRCSGQHKSLPIAKSSAICRAHSQPGNASPSVVYTATVMSSNCPRSAREKKRRAPKAPKKGDAHNPDSMSHTCSGQNICKQSQSRRGESALRYILGGRREFTAL